MRGLQRGGTLGAMDAEPGPDPLAVLLDWYREARERGNPEPDAMTLATVSAEGRPAARVMLFKGVHDGEIQFVSHYGGRKGREIAANPAVALVFFWSTLMRQVRVEGDARHAPSADSDAYFRTRSRESQLGAWASSQSEIMPSKEEFERRYAEAELRYRGRDVERPPGWGLFRVRPEVVELWISGPHRLHDRFRYRRAGSGWHSDRLYP